MKTKRNLTKMKKSKSSKPQEDLKITTVREFEVCLKSQLKAQYPMMSEEQLKALQEFGQECFYSGISFSRGNLIMVAPSGLSPL